MIVIVQARRASSESLPVARYPSYGGSIKNIPQVMLQYVPEKDDNQDDDDNKNNDNDDNGQEPQQQAVFFYRRLLRAESYRKALVWQKRLIIIINYCD